MGDYYIIKDGKEVPVKDVLEWAKWYETRKDRTVRRFRLLDMMVSTVFLGLNHQYSPKGPPILYETMIFGGINADYQRRYTTRKQAIRGHYKALLIAFCPIRIN